MNSVILVFNSSGDGKVGGGGFCSIDLASVVAVYDRRRCLHVQNTAAPENLPLERTL
jgi:hypothetical protein